jgi:hypothetical protein
MFKQIGINFIDTVSNYERPYSVCRATQRITNGGWVTSLRKIVPIINHNEITLPIFYLYRTEEGLTIRPEEQAFLFVLLLTKLSTFMP